MNCTPITEKKTLKALTFIYTSAPNSQIYGRGGARGHSHEFLGGPLPSSLYTPVFATLLSTSQVSKSCPLHNRKETPKPKEKHQTITTQWEAPATPPNTKGSQSLKYPGPRQHWGGGGRLPGGQKSKIINSSIQG